MLLFVVIYWMASSVAARLGDPMVYLLHRVLWLSSRAIMQFRLSALSITLIVPIPHTICRLVVF